MIIDGAAPAAMPLVVVAVGSLALLLLSYRWFESARFSFLEQI